MHLARKAHRLVELIYICTAKTDRLLYPDTAMGNKKFYLLRLVLLVSDFAIINFPFLLINLFTPLQLHTSDKIITFFTLIIFNVLWLILSQFFRLYTYHILAATEYIFRITWRTLFTHFLCFGVAYFLVSRSNFNGKFLFGTFGLMLVFFTLSRFLLTYIMEFVFKTVIKQKKIAIIGYNEQAKELAEYFNNNKSFYELAGIFGTSRQLTVDTDGKLIGNIKDCLDYAVENDISEIYSTILPTENELVQDITDIAEDKCVRVRFVTTKSVDNSTYYNVDVFSQMPVISLRSEPLQKTRNSLRKRMFDIIISSLAIICVLSWLTPILAIIIKMSSRGPVFFKQERSGKDNKPFWCYKFRSMTVNNADQSAQATKKDSRITGIGAFMRKTSIDELPQFFNVLSGDMSITGPRPHMLLHTEMYSAIIKKYMVRQFLKPGITGWAQVNGYRGETADPSLMEKRVECDIWYMENWSLMLDIKILFMTVINIFKGEENAY